MKFQTISRKAEALANHSKHLGIDGLYYRVNYMLTSATCNANDTFAGTEVEQGSKEFLRVELASLACLLCDNRDEEVTGWFKKKGFKF